jgi:hypothetical protein
MEVGITVVFTATGILMVSTMALSGEASPDVVVLATAGSAGGVDLPTAALVARADSVDTLPAGMAEADSLVTAAVAGMVATDRQCFG